MSSSDDKASEISPSLWQRLHTDEVSAWQELLFLLLPSAMERIRQGFELPARDDKVNPEAVLLSAWPSFQRHFLTDKKLGDALDFETLAAHFLRIAYNRSQRRKRQEIKMRRATAQGNRRLADGQEIAFDAVDSAQLPDDDVARSDFLAYFQRIVNEEIETLRTDARWYQIVQTWLAEDLQISQVQISERVGVHQATVSRVLDGFKERIRRRLAEPTS